MKGNGSREPFLSRPRSSFLPLFFLNSFAEKSAVHNELRAFPVYTWTCVIQNLEVSDEIDIAVTVSGDELTVLATFTEPGKFPYREAELLGVAEYKIVDEDGKVVREGATDKSSPVVNGQTAILIDQNGLENGTYKLVINAFVSEKKADQPLKINGCWEAVFII